MNATISKQVYYGANKNPGRNLPPLKVAIKDNNSDYNNFNGTINPMILSLSVD